MQTRPDIENPDTAERLVDVALDLAGRRGWRGLSLAEVAAAAGVPLPEAYATYPTRTALLAGMIARIDRRVLADGPADPDETPRDRLFEVLMRRFDALQKDRAGILAVLRDLPAEPLTAAPLLPHLATAMTWMLEAARLPAGGLAGTLRVKALAVVWLLTLRTWAADDSPDLARTMAALDKALREVEGVARRCPLFALPAADAADGGSAGADEPA
jgi:AcrR family transcriptional regulator